SSGNARSATYSGGVTLGQAGALAADSDKAAQLDGSSGSVTTPLAQTGVSQYTIEAWVKTTATGLAPLAQTRGAVGGSGKSLTLTVGNNGGQGTHAGTVNFGLDGDGLWIGGYTAVTV